jgi:hypothetical protein
MNTFVILLLAHLIADFPLQTNRIFSLKTTQPHKGLFLHVAVHLLVAAILLQNPLRYAPLLLAYVAIHYVVDWLKLRQKATPQVPGFLLDQAAHLLTIVLLAAWQPDLTTYLPDWLAVLGVMLAFVPAILTFLWVWATDLQAQQPNNATADWASHHLLPLSQRLGSILVLSLTCLSLIAIV